MLALGINIFLVPNEIAAGGVSGLATVLFLTLHIPLSVTVLIINGLLFVGGVALLKRWELVKSLLGVAFLSLFLEITSFLPTYVEDSLMAAVAGGVVCGLGIGITVARGASTGGTDMLGLMVSRKTKRFPVAAVMLAADGAVILLSGVAFSSVTIMLYAVLTAYISAKVTDFITVYGENAKQIQIISGKSGEIAKRIMNELRRGTTGIYSKGMYTGADSMTVLCVVHRRQVHSVIHIVKEIDKYAFITVGDVREVIGEGFKDIE